MEKAMMMKKFGEKYPKVKAILDQVQASESIDQNDKEMINNQLMCMVSALRSSQYKIFPGLWRGGNTYSAHRARIVQEGELITDETIFTITANEGGTHVYIDLPIAVAV